MLRSITARIAALVALVLVAPAVAHAATIRVESNGVDALECGTMAAPCLTIQRGIIEARTGDTVLVGPGTYAPATVSKRVTLQSTGGAGVTVIDAAGTSDDALRVTTSGVSVGKPGKGFTLTGATGAAGSAGIRVAFGATDVQIAGVLATGNGLGVSLNGDVAEIDIWSCIVSGNAAGGIVGANPGGRIAGNLVQGNGAEGIRVFIPGGQIRDNVVTGHDTGISANFHLVGGLVRDNVVTGNGIGMEAINDDVLVTRNAIIANGQGLTVLGQSVIVTENNFYGNGAQSPSADCGIVSQVAFLDARNNFWGAPSGPGPDPADAVCITGGGSVETDPPAPSRFGVNPDRPKL